MSTSSAVEVLLAQQARFRAFLLTRLGNDAEVDDLLQNGLVKALESADSVRDGDKLTAWFYQVLRNSIVDHVRSRNAAHNREDAWTQQASVETDCEASKSICHCFEALLPELKPREAELIRRVELGNESLADAANALGMTPNNASVTLHRARKALRERLEAFCGSCATGACLDCDCETDQTTETA